MLWLSDLHLDRSSPAIREALLTAIAGSPATPMVLTGDISNATSLIADLEAIASRAERPLYFVLGNHDHFGASIATVRDEVIALSERRPDIQWLPRAGVIPLPDSSVLVGVDGWADGRQGDALKSPLRLNDDRLIAELATQDSRVARLQVRRVLADADAARLGALLEQAVRSSARRVVVATHVPPFVEALRPGSRAAHPHWHPLLVCGATGAVLRRFAEGHADVHVVVLSGHSHVPYQAQVLPNLRVLVSAARYGEPEIGMRVLDVFAENGV